MTEQQRYRLLLGGAFLFLLLAYGLAFGKTWDLYQETQQLDQQRSSAGRAWQEIEQYQQQLQQLEAQQGPGRFDPNDLFQSVTAFCQEHQLAIQSMPESAQYQEQDLVILHHTIQVQGAFVPMVQLLYALEQEQQLGRVVSVAFSAKRNNRTRTRELTATIALQNIQKQPASNIE